jgi:methionyl-tRNA formyltransferase
MAKDPSRALPRAPVGRPLRLGFFGTPELAVPSLQALLAEPDLADVRLVVVQPDKPKGRGQSLQKPPVALAALDAGLPLMQPEKIRSGPFPEQIESAELDVACVIAYGRILTSRLLEAPSIGCVNVHASLLPRWRGAGPIQHAILAGDQETGICTMWMTEGLDEGPILLERRLPIAADDTSGSLGAKLAQLGARTLVETLGALRDGALAFRPQSTDGITIARLLEKSDGLLRWDEPAETCRNRVRAMSPWPGAFTGLRGEPLRVHDAAVEAGEGSPGRVIRATESGIVVACGRGALALRVVQLPGRKALSAAEFLRGCPVERGERLEIAS